MRKIIAPTFALAAIMALAACGGEAPMAETEMTNAGNAETAANIDFGDDTSEWANDGECDDPRFQGPEMTATALLDADILHDATDCRAAFESGKLQLRAEEPAPTAPAAAAPAADAPAR